MDKDYFTVGRRIKVSDDYGMMLGGRGPGTIGWRAMLYSAQSAEEARLMVRGCLMFYGRDFVKADPFFPVGFCEIYYTGPWAGCFCSPLTLAAIEAELAAPVHDGPAEPEADR